MDNVASVSTIANSLWKTIISVCILGGKNEKKLFKRIFLIVTIGLFISSFIGTAYAKEKYKSASVKMNGSCFTLTLKAKKECSGSVEVGFYKGGQGYWLNDSYSMIKNGQEIIRGCWNESQAEIGKGPVIKGTINIQQG